MKKIPKREYTAEFREAGAGDGRGACLARVGVVGARDAAKLVQSIAGRHVGGRWKQAGDTGADGDIATTSGIGTGEYA